MRVIIYPQFTEEERTNMVNMLEWISKLDDGGDYKISENISSAFTWLAELFRSDPECEKIYRQHGW